jgi:hypothetical protein
MEVTKHITSRNMMPSSLIVIHRRSTETLVNIYHAIIYFYFLHPVAYYYIIIIIQPSTQQISTGLFITNFSVLTVV